MDTKNFNPTLFEHWMRTASKKEKDSVYSIIDFVEHCLEQPEENRPKQLIPLAIIHAYLMGKNQVFQPEDL